MVQQLLHIFLLNPQLLEHLFVFFELITDEKDTNENQSIIDIPENIINKNDCRNGNHSWGDWILAWEKENEDGTYYGWDKRICKICDDEEWTQRSYPTSK